jgi:hypothetical protein
MAHRSHSSRNAAKLRPRQHDAKIEQSGKNRPADTQNHAGFFQGASNVNASYSNFNEVTGNHTKIQNIHNIYNRSTDPEIEVSKFRAVLSRRLLSDESQINGI